MQGIINDRMKSSTRDRTDYDCFLLGVTMKMMLSIKNDVYNCCDLQVAFVGCMDFDLAGCVAAS